MTIIQKGELMGDLISRQAAIAEIMEDIKDRSLHDDPGTPEDYAEGYDEGIRNAAVIVLQMPSAQPVVISKSENATECEDAVSRFEVLRLIDYSSHDLNDAVDNRYMQNEIKQLPSVTPKQPGWIPWDSGRFPEESGTYTVTAYDGATKRVTYAKYQKRLKRWELTGSRAYWKVLAWQPLPTPYREGGQDG